MLRLYNTLSRKKEIFQPRRGKKVNMFVCGPTVYDFSHIGHARTYIVFDVLARFLNKLGYDVFYLQNITDIDDKIIARANSENRAASKVAKEFEAHYLRDMKALGIASVKKYARATDFIPQIIGQVKRLLKAGYAYQIDDGIYFNIMKFKRYGKLAGRTSLQAQDAVSRVDEGIRKTNKGDFCLWKFSKSSEPQWPSPWGPGRPGWHIEDTAISEHFFGPQYDIHGGAIDIIFPHHECEIAQQEAASKKVPFVRYWLHTGFLTVRGEKMSKSVGNFVTIRDILKLVDPQVFRLLVLSSHWRSPLNYSDRLLEQAAAAYGRLEEFQIRLAEAKSRPKSNAGLEARLEKETRAFYGMLEDDLNTPGALACLFNVISVLNPSLEKQNQISSTAIRATKKFLKDAGSILGIISKLPSSEIPKTIRDMVERRETLRKENKWHASDELRRRIEKAGWVIEDTSSGTRVKAKSRA